MERYDATYSPEDNKLRLYSALRLPDDIYAQAKAHGFRWAPKQELFVAPMWTPSREDFLLDLCGEIGDEDTSLVERAAQRSERFEDYSDNRKSDAERAHKSVSAIADNIPLGQPILVGHHSERHARRDAKRIENGMKRAVKMWETSQYWTARAQGAIRAAKYKELPTVRARRIKGLGADKRKRERSKAQAAKFLKTYQDPEAAGVTLRDGRELLPALLKTYEGGLSHEDQTRFEREQVTFDEAKEKAINNLSRIVANCDRWINHYENRLVYETAMLEEQGATALLKPKARPALLPICNYKAKTITAANRWHRGETITYQQIEMTAKEYARIHTDYKGTSVVENSHRVRTAMQRSSLVAVFLTDSKIHAKPQAQPEPERAPRRVFESRHVPPPEPTAFDAMRESLKAGVQVVSAPQLFPTPPELAARMIEEADIQPGHDVLEPSAGTGNLVKAMPCIRPQGTLTTVEINPTLSAMLHEWADRPICGDFLEHNGDLGKFDRIVMNPPFINGADIKHIQHARTLLKPGGRLVALCANGPRQQAALRPIADTWEDLPAGSFSEQGTNVNVALLVINA